MRRPQEVASALVLKRAVKKNGAGVVLEGSDDFRLFRPLLHSNAALEADDGRAGALEALAALRTERVPGILAIVDADFARVDGESNPADVLAVDFHDVETMLLESPALDKVLVELGSETKLENMSPRSELFAAAAVFGYLRWAAKRLALPVRFENFPIEDFVYRESLICKPVAQVALRLLEHSKLPRTHLQQWLATVSSLQSTSLDPREICCGHDLVAILGIGLRKRYGSRSKKEILNDKLESLLRAAYESAFFATTSLAAQLGMWQSKHPEYSLIRQR